MKLNQIKWNIIIEKQIKHIKNIILYITNNIHIFDK